MKNSFDTNALLMPHIKTGQINPHRCWLFLLFYFQTNWMPRTAGRPTIHRLPACDKSAVHPHHRSSHIGCRFTRKESYGMSVLLRSPVTPKRNRAGAFRRYLLNGAAFPRGLGFIEEADTISPDTTRY